MSLKEKNTNNIQSDYIIFNFEKDKNIVSSNNKEYNNNENKNNQNINNEQNKNNIIFNYSSKELHQKEDISFYHSILNKTLNNTQNNTNNQSKEKIINPIIKKNQKKNDRVDDILKLNIKNFKKKNIFHVIRKKSKLISTGQQTQTHSLSSKNYSYKNMYNSWRNNSMTSIILRNDIGNSLETYNTNNINSFNFNERKLDEKIFFKNNSCAKNRRGLYGQVTYRNNKNKTLNNLKKSNIKKNNLFSSKLVNIEQYKRKSKEKKMDLSNKLKIMNYYKILSKNQKNCFINMNNIINKNKSDRSKLKYNNGLSQIIFSILKNNRDNFENKFEFKLRKPSKINLSTMLELNKNNFHKNKYNNNF